MRSYNSGVLDLAKRQYFVLVLIYCAGMAIFPAAATAQNTSLDRLWRTVPANEAKGVVRAQMVAAVDDVGQFFLPKRFRLFDLDAAVLKQLAAGAPNETAARVAVDKSNLTRITIPMPDGSFRRFELIESPAMSRALAAKFPQIRSFRGNCVDDPLFCMRLDISPDGMHAQVCGPDGTIIVQLA